MPSLLAPAVISANALGRLPGWIAQWLEMHAQKQKIGRPRQIYQGERLREYVPIERR